MSTEQTDLANLSNELIISSASKYGLKSIPALLDTSNNETIEIKTASRYLTELENIRLDISTDFNTIIFSIVQAFRKLNPETPLLLNNLIQLLKDFEEVMQIYQNQKKEGKVDEDTLNKVLLYLQALGLYVRDVKEIFAEDDKPYVLDNIKQFIQTVQLQLEELTGNEKENPIYQTVIFGEGDNVLTPEEQDIIAKGNNTIIFNKCLGITGSQDISIFYNNREGNLFTGIVEGLIAADPNHMKQFSLEPGNQLKQFSELLLDYLNTKANPLNNDESQAKTMARISGLLLVILLNIQKNNIFENILKQHRELNNKLQELKVLISAVYGTNQRFLDNSNKAPMEQLTVEHDYGKTIVPLYSQVMDELSEFSESREIEQDILDRWTDLSSDLATVVKMEDITGKESFLEELIKKIASFVELLNHTYKDRGTKLNPAQDVIETLNKIKTEILKMRKRLTAYNPAQGNQPQAANEEAPGPKKDSGSKGGGLFRGLRRLLR